MEIVSVEDKKLLNEFIKLPWQIYGNDPNWVPPLIKEIEFLFSEKNPFWQHSEKKLFLIWEGNRPLGRIAGIIDHNHINIHQENCGFFGFFESINDYAVAEKLLNVVREYLKEKKMEVMRGPMNPSTNDECGFLIEGFDSAPTVMMTYNPEYYLEFMERYGLRKAKDFYAYLAPVTGEQITRLSRVSELVKKREPNLVVRPINLKKFAEELGKIKQIYNSAWSKNWGFVPMTDGEIESMAERLKPLVVPEILQIAEFDGKPAGFLMAVPDYNQVMKRINGKLNLSGIVKFLWYKNKIDALRLITLGVCPEYRKKGIDGLLYLESLKGAMKKGYKFCEFSWVLEENILTQRAAEFMGGKLYKKYRIYEIKI
jgi:hypothetical protein